MKNLTFSFMLLFVFFGFTLKSNYKPLKNLNVIIKNDPGGIAFSDVTNRKGIISKKLDVGNYEFILFERSINQAFKHNDKKGNRWTIALTIDIKEVNSGKLHRIEHGGISTANDNYIKFSVPAGGAIILVKAEYSRVVYYQKCNLRFL